MSVSIRSKLILALVAGLVLVAVATASLMGYVHERAVARASHREMVAESFGFTRAQALEEERLAGFLDLIMANEGIARRFAARGHDVRIVTAGGGRREVDGIEVVGVRAGYSDYVSATAVSYPRRMLAFARFALAACAAALRGPRPDVIYATSPPLTMALPTNR